MDYKLLDEFFSGMEIQHKGTMKDTPHVCKFCFDTVFAVPGSHGFATPRVLPIEKQPTSSLLFDL